MTHFTTLVLTHPGQNPETLLAPYEEYGARLTRTVHTIFEDNTEEVLEAWENRTETRVVMPDGRLLDGYDEEFRVPGTFGKTYGGRPEHQSHRVPDGLERRKVPVRELYPDLPRFVEEYFGYEPHPTEAGHWGGYTNPKGYWDWYMLGGRWTGRFSRDGRSDTFPVSEWNGEIPTAIITPDGEWHAQGRVGWFGYVGRDGEAGEWEERVHALMAQHDGTTVHNFDLHT